MVYVPEEIYRKISQALALSVAELHGFVTFYHPTSERIPLANMSTSLSSQSSCQAMDLKSWSLEIKKTKLGN